ncbi:hypothetical protein TanjilG_29361 [Lupinus angustifolius]|uniref:Reverse transcriptase Ty1/copia-type domain-containing protein n=1 Tax=Lupinus angustifolius TaxID=3871 RepID=A0A394DDS0_LUPAN|nr:hypothetical protein TanjilG_29361 [Lupinus angustifolius]
MYKARLVAKGFHQQLGMDYNETFSPVVKLITIRILLTLTITFQWPLEQLDINNAFLNGLLNEKVYMQQPTCFQHSDKTLVCKLHKAIYGLKQAPKQWFEKLKGTLFSLGFTTSKCDNSLFIHFSSTYKLYVLVYVDDIIVTRSSQSHVQQLISSLNSAFALKQLGKLDYFLGIEVKHLQDGSLHLNQSKYVKDLLERAHMHLAKSAATPMASNCKLTKHGGQSFEDPTLYKSIVGALQYATITRPDIAFSVNKVCQFLSQPLQDHWTTVKRILRYLQCTNTYGIHLKPAPTLVPLFITTFCDVDWATDTDDQKSISGACLFLGPNPITWWSKKQNTISRSSTEVEYRSLALATQELSWVESLLTELQLPYKTPLVLCDNLNTIAMAHNHVLHNRTKHVELDLFFVRDKIQTKTLHVKHIPSEFRTIDVLTKHLSTNKFLSLRRQLKVQEASVASMGYIRDLG